MLLAYRVIKKNGISLLLIAAMDHQDQIPEIKRSGCT